MFPLWHIIWGTVLVLSFKYLTPTISGVEIGLIFFASILVDIDHYFTHWAKTGSKNVLHAMMHLQKERTSLKEKTGKKNIRKLNLFHTCEFQTGVGILSVFYFPLFFVFVGLIFHSLLDVIWMVRHDVLDTREFFLTRRIKTIFF
jgi:ABC-type protease/lipase transport system fused ATPase/permease subunit